MDLTPRPLKLYCEVWGKKESTLSEWARRGWIPGVYKHGSGEWWVSPIDLINFEANLLETDSEEIEGELFKSPGQRVKVRKVVKKRGKRLQKPT